LVTVKICVPVSDKPQKHCQADLDRLLPHGGTGNPVIVIDKMKSCYLYSARNALIGGSWQVDEALRNAALFDYYWFIDSDISGFSLDLLQRMICMGKDVVTVPYEPKESDGTMVCGTYNPGNIPRYRNMMKENVFLYYQCDWSGMGCVLFHKSVFTRKLRFPWFYPVALTYYYNGFEYREVVGEDIAISRDLRARGIKFNILNHPLVHKLDG